MDPYSLPCHPEFRLDQADGDWRAVGVKTADGVRRKPTRCPGCKSSWTAYERVFPGAATVEWLQSVPFRVHAVPLGQPDLPLWQSLVVGASEPTAAPRAGADETAVALAELQQRTGSFEDWTRSVQLVTVVQPVMAEGQVFAQPGDLLLERREKWNAQDRRLALLWSPRLDRPVVAWHSFARLPQAEPPNLAS